MAEYHPYQEPKLVRELTKGSLTAFNALYNQYSQRLYRFAWGYLKSEEEAEELVQDVFTIIWEKRSQLKSELSFRSFLFTISFNIIRKHFRTRAHLNKYFKGLGAEGENDDAWETVSFDTLMDQINNLVEQMPGRRKEIFIKSRCEGLTIKEIANQLNISHKTVENQITEALRFLRKNLNDETLPAILILSLFFS